MSFDESRCVMLTWRRNCHQVGRAALLASRDMKRVLDTLLFPRDT